jgi:hypothetical protein
MLAYVQEHFLPQRHDPSPARRAFDPNGPLIFTHVPKTSGTPITMALNRALAPRKVFHGVDVSLFGDFVDFVTFAE